MAATVPTLVPSDAPPRKRFTRSEVETMINLEIFAGQKFELIDGDLIDKMGQNPPHAYLIARIVKLLSRLFDMDLIRVQSSIEVHSSDRERSWPEPDIAVLAEAKLEYRHRHPNGNELVLLVEVADSSVQQDSGFKRDLYARAGVPEYWVLDINGRKLIVHREPRDGKYGQVQILGDDAAASIELLPGASMPVAAMLA